MVELVWSIVGIIVALCVAVLAVVLVVWAIMNIGLEIIKKAGESKIQIAWLKRIFGSE